MRLGPVLWVLLLAAAASSAFSLPLQAQSRREHGLASYYGQVHDGRRTANGERFDMQAMTAAHRTLPFGTQVRVTNLANGQVVILRINDRGPYVRGRMIDVSYAAAKRIGLLHDGLARVSMEVL